MFGHEAVVQKIFIPLLQGSVAAGIFLGIFFVAPPTLASAAAGAHVTLVSTDTSKDPQTSTEYTIEDWGEYGVDFDNTHAIYFSWADTEPFETEKAELYFRNELGEYEFVTEVIETPENSPPLTTAIDAKPGDYELRLYHALAPSVFPTLAMMDVEDQVVTIIRFELEALPECCSSVVFLPGFKGSVLKKNTFLGSDTLWPPTIWSDDVSELALTAAGESANDIFVDGIVETFKGTSIYDEFVSFMDGLVVNETIDEWQPIAYDWRFSPEAILVNGVSTADGILDIVAEIERVAENSATRQVTIVAHSMGGLLGKALIQKLESEGKADLIDTFVMVGTPQLGTPKALASLLHGDDEGIPNTSGLASILNNSVVDPASARTIGLSLPSSHLLLPSSTYGSRVLDPLIIFDDSTALTENWRTIWGNEIGSVASLVSFLTGAGDSRVPPTADDLKTPAVLRPDLLTNAQAFHNAYDPYVFPENIRVVQVAGWGLPTMKGIKYVEEHDELDYRPVFTVEGDETVVYASAVPLIGKEKYYFNLDTYREFNNLQIRHRDILNGDALQEFLTSIINEEILPDTQFVTTSKPSTTDVEDQLLVSAHSPVIIGAYDSSGNFTGIDEDQQEIIEEIPGSSFQIFGQSQYIFLPQTGIYQFVYEGTGTGDTTIRISSFGGDTQSEIASFSDIATTPETTASFSVDSSVPQATEIAVDIDGDGSVDMVRTADDSDERYDTLEAFIAFLKLKVSLVENEKVRKKIIKIIDRLEKFNKSGKPVWTGEKLNKESEKILRKIEKWIKKKEN